MDATIAAVGTSERLTWRRIGFWRRFAAALIDGIILAIVSGILRALLGVAGSGLGLAVSAGYFTVEVPATLDRYD